MIEINIDSEYIKLDQLLKLADAVSTGCLLYTSRCV